MQINILRIFCGLLQASLVGSVLAAEAAPPSSQPQTVDLTPRLSSGDVAQVTAKLEVGGEVLVTDDAGEEKPLPMSVVAELAYTEQFVLWSADVDARLASLRRYDRADATLKVGDQGEDRSLPAERRDLVAVAVGELQLVNRPGAVVPLTRAQLDLVDLPANTLVLDRLMPGGTMTIGDNWAHDALTMAALLGLDRVGACEVHSAAVGVERDQVQIRMAGTVNGTADGAATELEVRGAYLFHLKQGRITKFNLAVQEKRKAGEISPGLDVTAKLTLVVKPVDANQAPFDAEAVAEAADAEPTALARLAVDDPRRGFRFQHGSEWFVTGEQPQLLSLRLWRRGELLAHCNVTTLPGRSEKHPTTIAELEADVKTALGKKIESISAAEEWIAPNGNRCLAVFANGKVDEAPIQWRYYLITAPGRPQASVAVTVEQDRLEAFDNADRELIDTLEFVGDEPATAAKTQAIR